MKVFCFIWSKGLSCKPSQSVFLKVLQLFICVILHQKRRKKTLKLEEIVCIGLKYDECEMTLNISSGLPIYWHRRLVYAYKGLPETYGYGFSSACDVSHVETTKNGILVFMYFPSVSVICLMLLLLSHRFLQLFIRHVFYYLGNFFRQNIDRLALYHLIDRYHHCHLICCLICWWCLLVTPVTVIWYINTVTAIFLPWMLVKGVPTCSEMYIYCVPSSTSPLHIVDIENAFPDAVHFLLGVYVHW